MTNNEWQRPGNSALTPSYQSVMDELWSKIEITENNADYIVNFAYWTFDECKLIALGIAPHLMHDKVLKRVISVLKLENSYQELHEPFKRAYQAGTLGEQMEPRYFLKWAQKSRIAIPPLILSAVSTNPENKLPTQPDDTANRTSKSPASAQTRLETSFYKLIYAMAKSKYRFDQQGFSKNAVSAILSDLDRLGIDMSENTIRTHLHKSKEIYENMKK